MREKKDQKLREKRKKLAKLNTKMVIENTKILERSELKEKTQSILAKVLKRNEMPNFAMYSRFDKNLLKNMLFKATEFDDEVIPALRDTLFNPADKPVEGYEEL